MAAHAREEMAKGQVSIIYLALTIAIAVVLSAGVFLSVQFFSENLREDVAELGFENVGQQITNAFLDLKLVRDKTNETSINYTIDLPKQIGDQRYTIAAGGSNKFELRTVGSPSNVKNLELKFWSNLSAEGFIDSTQGFMELRLNTTNKDRVLIL
jgi:hypothetical protein